MAELPAWVEVLNNVATNNLPSHRTDKVVNDLCSGFNRLSGLYLEELGTNEELRALLAETLLKLPLEEAQRMLGDTKAHSEENKQLHELSEKDAEEIERLRQIIADAANLLETYSQEEAKKLKNSI